MKRHVEGRTKVHYVGTIPEKNHEKIGGNQRTVMSQKGKWGQGEERVQATEKENEP